MAKCRNITGNKPNVNSFLVTNVAWAEYALNTHQQKQTGMPEPNTYPPTPTHTHSPEYQEHFIGQSGEKAKVCGRIFNYVIIIEKVMPITTLSQLTIASSPPPTQSLTFM